MPKFLKRTFSFFFTLVAFFALNSGINYLLIMNSKPKLKLSKILILGDSHTQKSINPEFFPSAQNISQPGEPIVLSYWKLKYIFNIYTPDTVILGLAHHNISFFNDLKFSHNKWSGEMFKRSYLIEHFDEIDTILDVNFKGYYQRLFKQFCFFPRSDHHTYVGEYKNRNYSNLSDWNEAINRHYYFEGNNPGLSIQIPLFLDSIVNLCKKNGVQLVLVSNPLFIQYKEKIPKLISDSYKILKISLKEKNVIFLDHSKDSFPKKFFLNSDHLNSKGAAVYTNQIKKELQSL